MATLALTVLMFVCVPAVAQDTGSDSISIEADIGVDGWVELSGPVRLRVTIRSELLFSGSLELRHGRAEVTTAVEVPAGGEKTYELLISPTMATRALTIELVPSSDDSAVASIRVQPKDPNGNLLVGTMGFLEELDLPRDSAIASVPVVEVPVADGEGDLAPLDYLIVAGGVPVTDSMLRWVAEGGRLLVPPGTSAEVLGTSRVADEMRPGVYRLGDGQVVEQSRSTPSTEEWASVLVPFREEHHLSDFWGSSEVQMIRAASSSAKAGIPYSGVLRPCGLCRGGGTSQSDRPAAGSYMLTFMLLFATPLVAVGEAFFQTERFRQDLDGELFSLIPNPYLALGSAVLHPLEVNSVLTPFGPVHAYLLGREAGDTNFGGGVAANLIVEQDGHRFVRLTRPPCWVYSALFYV
ncbi:MAG: hypothetical protein LC739_13465, partial [Actinobacteria bacterium]|nr:hypothetical protein [Actinomycetota bacterium]